jgi:hypothetical protein
MLELGEDIDSSEMLVLGLSLWMGAGILYSEMLEQDPFVLLDNFLLILVCSG